MELLQRQFDLRLEDEERECPECGTKFLPKAKDHNHCSKPCWRRTYEKREKSIQEVEARARYERIRTLRRYYNMTLEEYEALLESQGGRCAICNTDNPGGRGSFHVDHDHRCCPGKTSCGNCIRGLLCHSCNTGIGAFGDDPANVLLAGNYLINYEAKEAYSWS